MRIRIRKQFAGPVLVALAMTMLVPAVALSGHRNPQLAIVPNPANVGDTVTVSGWDETTNGDVHVDECRLTADGTPVTHLACTTEGTGTWHNRAVKNNTELGGADAAQYVFTPSAGVYGFRVRSAHNETYGDLTVNPVTSGQRHNGCNGIENAITKVKPGGNAKAKLDEIAERFHCDV